MARILVADDEAGIREFMADALELDGHEVVQAADGEEAARRIERESFHLVITDLRMPRLDGFALLRRVRAEQPEVEVIVVTAYATVDSAVEAMKLGAFDYIQKPLSGPEELCLLVHRAVERRGLLDRQAGTARAQAGEPRLTHGDPVMRPIVDAIAKVARTSATVLLLGESGTGKEIAAREIHAQSERRGGPFMAINCAALTETLLESELFGHEKGAFTGATERRRGRIELADGGTFFLDEIAELRPELQAKLLRVLQERRFERVGGARAIAPDVRWIAATNRDLPRLIDEGRFREDLYHRLAVFPIRMPPLRERTQDLLPLARALLARSCRDLKREPLTLSEAAEQKLLRWRWPGNVRELANTLERVAILADEPVVRADQLWLEASSSKPRAELRPLVELEREAIEQALQFTAGNRRRAAELLGIGERTLYEKLRRYGVE